ncbi:BCCT family transporter, partial [Rubrobacter taiwanensis]
QSPAETALFALLSQLPVAAILITLACALGVAVVAIFFATSADSGSLVVDILTRGGETQVGGWRQRLVWAVLIGAVAATLLAAGTATGENALGALQTASITAGLPFCVVLLLMCVGLIRGLEDEGLPAMTPDPRKHGELQIKEAELQRHRSDSAPGPTVPEAGRHRKR